MSGYSIGVEVGAKHVTAGVFDDAGRLIGRARRELTPVEPAAGIVEQAGEAVWAGTCGCVRAAVATAGIDAEGIVSLGFAAVSALVALDGADGPCSVSASGDSDLNIILDLDRRATAEADVVNATQHSALAYSGGKVTAGHALPRLLWLKRHCPDSYRRARAFMDLSEYLVYRASAAFVRSRSVIACQWLYLSHRGEWPADLLRSLDLGDLPALSRLGQRVQAAGEPVGALTPEAADALCLSRQTVVAAALLDAEAGGVGLVGGDPAGKLALIGGPSARHVVLSREPRFAAGIGGPVQGAMGQDYWLSYAAQNAFGALLDNVITDSAGYPALLRGARETGRDVGQLLTDRVQELEARESSPTRSLHVLDYQDAARSPRSDLGRQREGSGVSLEQDVDALARRYLATIQALCYRTRHIAEVMAGSGHELKAIRACGQMAYNPLWCRELADATGLRLELPRGGDPMLLGTAVAAATAVGAFNSLDEGMAAWTRDIETIEPGMARAQLHEAKYFVYRQLYDDEMAQREVRARA